MEQNNGRIFILRSQFLFFFIPGIQKQILALVNTVILLFAYLFLCLLSLFTFLPPVNAKLLTKCHWAIVNLLGYAAT